jgi:hypothetical protein
MKQRSGCGTRQQVRYTNASVDAMHLAGEFIN